MDRNACSSDCWLNDLERTSISDHLSFPSPAVASESQARIAPRIFTPLKPWETRILYLHPARWGDGLEADLCVADLTTDDRIKLYEPARVVDYVALSYTWGAPIFSHSLLLNGEVYPITENLYHALHRLRSEDGRNSVNYIWVDALCINQHDLDERSRQVQNMLLIYRKAMGVFIWLGEHSGNSELLLDFSTAWSEREDAPSQTAPNMFCRGHAEALREAVQAWFARPWFSRIWIRQEIWAARVAFVICGATSVAWMQVQDLVDVVGILEKQLPATAEPTLLTRVQATMSGLREATMGSLLDVIRRNRPNPCLWDRDAWAGDIVNVLRCAVNSQASDPRDRIYGLLGMTSTRVLGADVTMRFHEDNQSQLDLLNKHLRREFHRGSDPEYDDAVSGPDNELPALTIDYKKPVVEVFQDTMRYLLSRDGCFSTLLLSATLGGEIEGGKLPSWVIDWRSPTSRGFWLEIFSVIWSAGRLEPSPVPPGHLGTGRALTVQGHCFGVLEAEVEEFEWILDTSGSNARPSDDLTVGDVEQARSDFLRNTPIESAASTDGTRGHFTPGKLQFRRRRVQPLVTAGGFDIQYLKHMQIAVKVGKHRPDFDQPPDFRAGSYRPPSLDQSKYWHPPPCSTSQASPSACGEPHERHGRANRSPFVMDRDGTLTSIWTVPHQAQEGDHLFFIRGGILPFVLRPTGGPGLEYAYIGPAMVNRGAWCDPHACYPWHIGEQIKRRFGGAPDYLRLKDWLVSACGPSSLEELTIV